MTKKIIVDGKRGLETVVNSKGEALHIPTLVDAKLWNRAMEDIAKNNTWCPDITRIIFNTKTEDWKRDKDGKPVRDKNDKKIRVKLDSPVLATTIEFSDDTKVTVQNSPHDRIEIVKDSKTGVMTASDCDKERAVVYAICKKLVGVPDEKGEVQGNGFGRVLRDLVESGWDQNVQEKLAEMKKADSKKAREAKSAEKKAKPRRMTLAEAMDKLGETLKEVEALKAKLNRQPRAAKRPVGKTVKPR